MKKNNLYLVLSSEYNKNIDILDIAAKAIDGGVDIIQMREKHMSDPEKIELGHKLCGLCGKNKVLFIVNDDPHIAAEVNADGVHLGQTDIMKYPIAKVREIIGRNKLIGLSTHSIEQFKACLKLGADYLAYGPLFETKTKDYHIGISQIEQVLSAADAPVVFIGGIDLKNIDLVLEKGVQNIALIRAIMQAEDITKTASLFKQKINKPIAARINQGGIMQVKINGKYQEIRDCQSLEQMIKEKGLCPENIVVEYNGRIIAQKQWQEIILKQNDIIEIVSFVGGG